MLHFKSILFLSLCSVHEELTKKFISHFIDASKICLSLPYSWVAFFLEKTPKALYFPYVAYFSLHPKFWRAWKRLSTYMPVFLKGLHLSVLKLKQNRLVLDSWNFFQPYSAIFTTESMQLNHGLQHLKHCFLNDVPKDQKAIYKIPLQKHLD